MIRLIVLSCVLPFLLCSCFLLVVNDDIVENTLPTPEPEPEEPPVLLADGFDFPVGPPNGKGYYNAQGFGKNTHLGDDWNGVGGGNSDFDDPVYSIARGIVSEVYHAGPGWGNVVRVLHWFERDSLVKECESLYAHLHQMTVAVGDTLRRGQQLGTIGNADGAYYAHLHFEIRMEHGRPLGGGYDPNPPRWFVDPTAFIALNRPL
jgi:murein DD-endopeptidase MepM/ murein hydrolase activator NlpD